MSAASSYGPEMPAPRICSCRSACDVRLPKPLHVTAPVVTWAASPVTARRYCARLRPLAKSVVERSPNAAQSNPRSSRAETQSCEAVRTWSWLASPRIGYCASANGSTLRPNASCPSRSEEHTSELQSQFHLVCRLLLEKKKK